MNVKGLYLLVFLMLVKLASADQVIPNQDLIDNTMAYLDTEVARIEAQKVDLEKRQLIFEQKQKIFDAQLGLYEAKQVLSDSRLERIRLDSERLELLQKKSELGRRNLESELVFPEVRGRNRESLQKQLEDVINQESLVNKEVQIIERKMINVDTLIVNQSKDVDRLAKVFFTLKSSVKIK